MTLFKIFQEFLLPSVFVLILILAGMILLPRLQKKKFGKILIILGAIFYYFFSITPIADLILAPLENQYSQIGINRLDQADKIVLLLGGNESDILRASEVLRIYHYINFQFPPALLQKGGVQIIISGTDPLNPKSNEAGEVKEYLIERGIPSEIIILEDKSRNTRESAKNLKEMLDNQPFFLVTSAYHMPRSMESFQKMGMNPIAAPADFKIKEQYDILDFFPDPQNLKNSNLAVHEYFGILWYRVKF